MRTRHDGLGDEPKRRIMLGTYALSSGYYDAYYGTAQKVRTVIKREHDALFERFDLLVSPTCATTAFPLGEKAHDPLAMYLTDVLTIPSNMAGLPGALDPGSAPAFSSRRAAASAPASSIGRREFSPPSSALYRASRRALRSRRRAELGYRARRARAPARMVEVGSIEDASGKEPVDRPRDPRRS